MLKSNKKFQEIINKFLNNEDYIKNLSSIKKGVGYAGVFSIFDTNFRTISSLEKVSNKMFNYIKNNSYDTDFKNKIKQHVKLLKLLDFIIEENKHFLITDEWEEFNQFINSNSFNLFNKNEKKAFFSLFLFSKYKQNENFINDFDAIQTLNNIINTNIQDSTKEYIKWFINNRGKNISNIDIVNNLTVISILFYKQYKVKNTLLTEIIENRLIKEMREYLLIKDNEIIKKRIYKNGSYTIQTFLSDSLLYILKLNNENLNEKFFSDFFNLSSNKIKNILNQLEKIGIIIINNYDFSEEIYTIIPEYILKPEEIISEISNLEYTYQNNKKDIINQKANYERDLKLVDLSYQLSKSMCSVDPKHKTFTSKNKSLPFLEAHHFIPLSYSSNDEKIKQLKLDDISNIFSICPNCHRQIHYGDDNSKYEIITKLFLVQQERIKYLLENILNPNESIKRWFKIDLEIEDYKKIYQIK